MKSCFLQWMFESPHLLSINNNTMWFQCHDIMNRMPCPTARWKLRNERRPAVNSPHRSGRPTSIRHFCSPAWITGTEFAEFAQITEDKLNNNRPTWKMHDLKMADQIRAGNYMWKTFETKSFARIFSSPAIWSVIFRSCIFSLLRWITPGWPPVTAVAYPGF